MKFMYKLSKSVIPCMLLTLSIGFCYAWSLFAPEIQTAISGTTPTQVQFAFCLNIFFLGMGAVIFGPLAERHNKAIAITQLVLLVAELRSMNLWSKVHIASLFQHWPLGWNSLWLLTRLGSYNATSTRNTINYSNLCK